MSLSFLVNISLPDSIFRSTLFPAVPVHSLFRIRLCISIARENDFVCRTCILCARAGNFNTSTELVNLCSIMFCMIIKYANIGE